MFSLLFILRKILIYSRINDTLKQQNIHTKKEKLPRTTSSKEGGKTTKRPHSMKAKTKSKLQPTEFKPNLNENKVKKLSSILDVILKAFFLFSH